ncbi:MAG: transcriptional regulator [Candidatus Bathyarchaeia archaeon]
MLLPCEVGVKTVLPAVKAIMARNIVEKHGLKEKDTAALLGLSQSAISRYMNRDRGNNLLEIEKTLEVQLLIDQMVTFLVKEPEKKREIMMLFCQTCRTIREKGLMCNLCHKDMAKDWAQECAFCQAETIKVCQPP